MRYVMNDYELVYLIQANNDHVALEFLFKKYEKFIWKQVHLLNISPNEHDDFFQEGMLMLFKAARTFSEIKGKTFTKYFELILKRHFYALIPKLPYYELHDNTDFHKGYMVLEEEAIELDFKSELEEKVYHLYFLNRQPIKNIAQELNIEKKTVYNAIYRIKEKYKNML